MIEKEPKIEAKQEKLIESKPKLKNIYNTLGLLEGYIDFKKNIPEKIGKWENSLELFNNVQKLVSEHINDKVISFKNETLSMEKLPNEKMIDAIVNNWPESMPEIRGQRREVLIAIAAHVVKHIETKIYQEIISSAEEEELKKLGLNSELREVVLKTIDASMRTDNLFIRFLAFSGLSQKPPKETSTNRLHLPDDKQLHTINELFPKDTQYISRKFEEILQMPINWEKIQGGNIFKDYIKALINFYNERDVNKIDKRHEEVVELYGKSILSDFPILIVPSSYESGYLKPPYHDPELRICLKIQDQENIQREKDISYSQKIMAECLEEEGYHTVGKKVKFVNSIGDYGVNLFMKGIAQEDESTAVIYLGEHAKFFNKMAKDKNFKVENSGEPYNLEKSFFLTGFHEFGHFHKPDDPGVIRMGAENNMVIDEVAAEQVYRWLLPRIIKKGGIGGTKEEWAVATIETSLEYLFDSSEKDPYYSAGIYTLNEMFEKGIIEFDFKTGSVKIKDLEAFYGVNEELAKKVLGLYDDKSMNEQKAKKWIKQNCKPNEILQKISDFLNKK